MKTLRLILEYQDDKNIVRVEKAIPELTLKRLSLYALGGILETEYENMEKQLESDLRKLKQS